MHTGGNPIGVGGIQQESQPWPRGERCGRCARLPASLTFTITGHSGNPDRPPNGKNYFQLVDAATGRVLKKTLPPRNDSGVEMEWDLRSLAGHRARLEIVDGDSNGSFAWLAVGGFKPDVAPIPDHDPATVAKRQQAASQVVHDLRLVETLEAASAVAGNPLAPTEARSLVAQAILANGNAQQQIKLTELLADEASPEPLRLAIATHGAHLSTVQEPLLKALGQAHERHGDNPGE